MQPFRKHTGVAVPMRVDNVDTDQIIPSREMRKVSKTGLGEGLFAGWRYEYEGKEKIGPKPDFVLNQPEYDGASILLGGKNFGCGSSREHAVWALADFGFRAVIAESFGRIFVRNCARNGVLAIELSEEAVRHLDRQIRPDPQNRSIGIDLEAETVTAPDGETFGFSVDESDRRMLLEGLDHVAYTLQYEDDITAYEKRARRERPWAVIAGN